ncbi:MAG: alpha-galactosidase [Natronospirillum sp.]|uniref:alpha-galactosidase n=1 Tax=Natronospirillum sp. TaxID=2812955 RepID=UPI0025D9F318|nr:alpha-galactosidase [Natronospirillum sp.]MCH8550753.1 alpha-galactosidase [Natronospirillum sp.]
MQDVYHLKGQHSSLIIGAPNGGVPTVLYWGEALPDALDHAQLGLLQSLPHPAGFLDSIPPLSLVPEMGRGFHGQAGLLGQRKRRDWAGQMQLDQVDVDEDGTHRLRCVDPQAGLQLDIRVSLNQQTEVVRLSAELTNTGDTPYQLDHLGLSVRLPWEADELLTFHGRWIQEFLTERQPWPLSPVLRENRRGRTSHASFPAMIAGEPHFSENRGQVWGLHLGYSGNHRLVAEKLLDGNRHIQLGEWLYPGEIELSAGQTYRTPETFGTWSGRGLNGLSQQFHAFVREQILDLDVTKRPRPVHLNTWEGIYFDHKPEQLKAMVRHAADVGVERFILDDGWFGRRDDDHAGLGDWFVDERKHPGGLGYLIEAVHQQGMTFGLWFEPEMVNPDSDLYRAHPDWILQVEGYDQPLGRHQYVLDIAKPEVFAYLLERLDSFLTEYAIDYIKWDMNRDLVQPGSNGIAGVHEQTQALYRLLAELRQRHPSVEIETCASGGGRIDFEILRHTQRIWTSDCIDARERQRIQYGYSLFLPPEINGSHISANPSHTTGRSLNLGYRLITAMFGHMGLELNVTEMSDAEKAQVRALVDLYKQHRSLLHTGTFWRLDTADPALQAYGVVSGDGRSALFAATTLELQKQMLLPPLRLQGLKPGTDYELSFWIPDGALGPRTGQSELEQAGGGRFSAELLMQAGVQLPILNPESALLLALKEV